MKTNYAPVKLPKAVKNALLGEEWSIKVDRDQNLITIISYCKKSVDLMIRMVKEQIIKDYTPDKFSQFTNHGIEVIEQIIENKKLLELGLPMDTYKHGHPKLEKVCRDYAGEIYVYTGEYAGKRFWSDGSILFAGEYPFYYMEKYKGDCNAQFPNPSDHTTPATIIGYSLSEDERTFIWLADGEHIVAVNSQFYDLAIKNIPDPVFHLTGVLKPVLVFSDDEFAGLVMPIRIGSVPLNIRELIKEKFPEVK